MKLNYEDDHWLTRRRTVRALIIAGVITLAITVAAQLVVEIKGRFEIDSWFAFGAVFGFLACMAMVVFAKGLGRFLKRGERYYDD